LHNHNNKWQEGQCQTEAYQSKTHVLSFIKNFACASHIGMALFLVFVACVILFFSTPANEY